MWRWGMPGKVQAEDDVGRAERLDEAPDLRPAPLGPADHEPVAPERVELVHRRGILRADERVLPAAPAVLVAVVHQEVPLGELERLRVGVGDHGVAGERPLGRVRPARRPQLGLVARLAVEQLLEVRGRAGHPRVGQARRPPDHQLAPAADPDRRMRPLNGLRLDPRVLERIVGPRDA